MAKIKAQSTSGVTRQHSVIVTKMENKDNENKLRRKMSLRTTKAQRI